ncbi:hypothetical protein VP1G_04632 [Cytospora mali]|uniref:Rhodopsin domain-containing protein n=1 Tax=Cytospora mali TaxID=578113 RepID=A0A194V069_CYTMA|nr:hypothetical protein VP1G_04632 [Valsa mali var. pyri (nom. inval.)]
MSNIGSETVTADHRLDEQSQVTWIVTIVSLACAISTVAVVLRIFTRLRILHIFGPDDALMGFAQLISIGSALAIGLETKWGLGRHIWIMQDEDYTPYMKSFYSSVITYNVAICVVKISIMIQYRRIFTGDILQKLTLIMLIFESCWATTLSILLPLVCTPVAAFWDKSVQGTCLDQLAIWYVMASINLVTDFVVFSIPLPVINSLQLPRKQKFMLMGVFGLGFFTCIISVYRMQTLRVAAHTGDATWDNTNAAVWSYIELAIGVSAASLPTLKPLFARMFPRLFKSTTSDQYRYNNNNHMSARNTGNMYGKSRTRNSVAPGGGIFIKDIDGDLNALRTNGSRGSEGSGSGGLELPIMYNVTVTGGKRDSSIEHGHTVHNSLTGIQTTTVVTQRVDSL